MNGRWTAGDIKALHDYGLGMRFIAWQMKLTRSAVKRILSKPDNFIVDTMPSKNQVFVFLVSKRFAHEIDYARNELKPMLDAMACERKKLPVKGD